MRTPYKWYTKLLIGLFAFLFVVVAAFFLGPRPNFDTVDLRPLHVNFNLEELDELIAQKEASIANLKPDNQARILWADSLKKQKTKYSIVYIHGFSASPGEGHPLHTHIAAAIGANLYLARLTDHGILDKEVFKQLTPAQLIEDAKYAIAVGRALGDTVIVMSCSTGSTLTIPLATEDSSISSMIMLSPNIAIRSESAKLLTGPWGRQLAHKIIGEYRMLDSTQSYIPYWTHEYRTEGLIALQALINQTMTREIFSKVKIPIYVGYYYKDEINQDPVVSVAAMQEFKKQVSTPTSMIEYDAFPNANDHVIGSMYKTIEWPAVRDEILDFINKIYGIEINRLAIDGEDAHSIQHYHNESHR